LTPGPAGVIVGQGRQEIRDVKGEKPMPKDDWDARFIPEKRRRFSEGRKQGLFLILVAIGIPLIVFFFQDDGALRFYSSEKVFERNITPKERQEIGEAVAKYKAGLDTIQKAVENVKEKYRGEIGEGYGSEMWIVHEKDGVAIPFKYFLGLGSLLALIGLGKLIL
jgi:hypothetical protein